MSIHCLVAGREVPSRSVSRRAMNFGQPCPGLQPLPYRIEMSLGDLVAALRPVYEQAMAELVADEPCDDGSIPVVNELRALGWPGIDALATERIALLLRVAHDLLAMELLDAVFPHGFDAMQEPAFTLNTVDSVQASGATISITGEAYPLDLRPLRSRPSPR